MKKIFSLMLALTVLCTLTACGGANTPENQDPETPTGNAAYTVKVVDALGTPYTEGIIVRFLQGGTQVSMQTVGPDGTASKELPAGEYTVELKFTDADGNYHYDTGLTLTSANREDQVVLSRTVNAKPDRTLFAGNQENAAYAVTTGCTYVPLTAGARNYFLFTPTEPGKYQFSLVDSTSTIGYYGAPHFVQENNAAELVNEDGSFYVNVKAGMISTGNTGTTVMVLGIDAAEDSAILAIQRVGEPDWDPSDEPWHTYTPTIDLQTYTHPAGTQLAEFDLTASTDAYTLVLGSDNYYHLNTADGPLVLVRLGKNSGGSKYLADFQTILDHSGINKYFWDENGEFVKKETYDQCLQEYFSYMDEASGLYPLTEDLKYIIQMRGDHAGWFTSDGALYLFKDQNGDLIPGINSEIAWLFMCCYVME